MALKKQKQLELPVGTQALILSKYYYGVLGKALEDQPIDRYFSVLYFLYTNNGCSQQHICNNLAIDKTAMVKVMNYLITAGMVERKTNPGDRREHYVKLTVKGTKHTKVVVNSFLSIEHEVFKKVSKRERENFLKVMSTLTEHLKGMPGTDLFFNINKTARPPKAKKAVSNTKVS